jgi:DNA-binding XRE family transcriptional regulator
VSDIKVKGPDEEKWKMSGVADMTPEEKRFQRLYREAFERSERPRKEIAAEVGVGRQTIYAWKTDCAGISFSNAIRAARALGFNPSISGPEPLGPFPEKPLKPGLRELTKRVEELEEAERRRRGGEGSSNGGGEILNSPRR